KTATLWIVLFYGMLYLIILFLQLPFISLGQDLVWTKVQTNMDASFRGLSVVDWYTAWVGGTNGVVGRSTDEGKNWTFTRVKNCEKCDFRSVYAFDSLNAVIANAGSPAHIFRTGDGGKTWRMVYEQKDSAAFFDGIDFWNDEDGVIYGDPIDGKMLLL